MTSHLWHFYCRHGIDMETEDLRSSKPNNKTLMNKNTLKCCVIIKAQSKGLLILLDPNQTYKLDRSLNKHWTTYNQIPCNEMKSQQSTCMTNLQLLLMHRKVTGFDVQHTTTRKTQHVLRRRQDESKLQKIHNTLSKMSVVLLRLALLLMSLHGLKLRLVWFTEHDVGRTITTPP